MMNSLRIIFAGTSNFSAYHLYALISNNYEIISVLTKPDFIIKRKKNIFLNPVKSIAQRYNIPILQPESLKIYKYQKKILELNADIIIVASYGLILPKIILNAPRFGCINIHCSLLPRWRGSSPIQKAIYMGDKITGVSIIKMNCGIDTGDILNQKICKINNKDNSYSLTIKLAKIGVKALFLTLKEIVNNTFFIKHQNEYFATYAYKINKYEAKINWYLSAKQISRYIRAFNPWPVSFFYLKEKIIKVWHANISEKMCNDIPGTILNINKNGIYIATGKGILILTLIQAENSKIMSILDFLNSRRNWFIKGDILK